MDLNERHRRATAFDQCLFVLSSSQSGNDPRIEGYDRGSAKTQAVFTWPMSGFFWVVPLELGIRDFCGGRKIPALVSSGRPFDLMAAYQPDYTPMIIEILLLAVVVTLACLIAMFGVHDWRGRLERARSSLQAQRSLAESKGGPAALAAIVVLIPILASVSLTLTIVTLILGRKEPYLITWRETEPSPDRRSDTQIVVARIDVSGVLDPVTGTGFSDGESAWRCTSCQMFYHNQTYRFLRDQNFGCCVGCGQGTLRRSTVGTVKRPRTRARRPERLEPEIRREFIRGPTDQTVFQPPAVGLAEIGQYVGHVVYFQGRVVEVQRSKSANTYCVKFQRGPWASVFKLVIFSNYVNNFAHGERTLREYTRKTIRVRGLVQRHPEWGLEILVYDESAIVVLE